MPKNKIIKPLKIPLDLLFNISQNFGPTSVEADQFFVAYNAVVTLAYKPFSKTLLGIKSFIENSLGEHLTEENFSSKWPKTTLGCLKNKIVITDQQLMTLRTTCLKFNDSIHNLPNAERTINIDGLKIIVFLNRTLEKRLISIPIPLLGNRLIDDATTNEHIAYVKSVLQQFDETNHTKYYPEVATTNRTIRNYYRKKHIETTLIAAIHCPKELKQIVLGFQNEVDSKLPNVFSWFHPDSWHMTIRSLIGKQ